MKGDGDVIITMNSNCRWIFRLMDCHLGEPSAILAGS